MIEGLGLNQHLISRPWEIPNGGPRQMLGDKWQCRAPRFTALYEGPDIYNCVGFKQPEDGLSRIF